MSVLSTNPISAPSGFQRELHESLIPARDTKHSRNAAPPEHSLKKVLTSLFHRVERCLLQYAAHADLWVPASLDAEHFTLENTARWQRESLKPLAKLIERRHRSPLPLSFPAEYTRFHDVSLSFLLPAIITDLEETIEEISSARQDAMSHQDSEALIVLNRLQGEQRLLLAGLRQHTLHSTQTAEETDGHPLEAGHRPQLLTSNARASSRTGTRPRSPSLS